MRLKKGISQLEACILVATLFTSITLQAKWNYKHKSNNITDTSNISDVGKKIYPANQNQNIKQKNKPEPFNQKNLEYKKLDEEYLKNARKLKTENQTEKSIEYYKKAIQFNSKNLLANFELGCTLYNEGKPQEAIQYYKNSIDIDSTCAQAYFNLSLCYCQTKQEDEAIEILKKLIEIKPDYSKSYRQIGVLLQKNKKYEEAIPYLKKACETNETLQTLISLGRSLKKLDRIEESVDYFKKALEQNPTNLLAILELANTLNVRCKGKDDLEAALELYKKALEKDPNLNTVRYNIAYTLKRLDRVEEAMPYYQEAVKRNPTYPQARFSLGLAHLVLGDFDNGWPEYEYRWESYKETPKKYDMPIWDGSDLSGKTILVCAEQGLGDTFQFLRYTQILKRLGATIIFETQKPLVSLLSLCDYIDKVIPRGGSSVPSCDYQVYLLSLPLKFKTTIDTVPDNIPYLQAKPELIEYWRDQLSQDKNFKIGICWQGNRFYRTQALKHAVSAKSIPLPLLKPLAEIPGVSLYSLQKMSGEDQLKDIDFDIHIFDKDFDDTHGRFMDTAAVIKNLDLVISVDTSICHLSAALGVPVWNMLPKPADWRWLLKTTRTPWYPNMKLFRQKEIGDWEGLIKEVSEELITVVQKATQTKKTQNSNQSQSKKLDTQETKSNIVFHDIKDMVFEETVDKLIVLNIKYENHQDPTLLQNIKKLEAALEQMASVYKNNDNDTKELDKLSEKLCSVNRELLKLEQQALQIEDKSMFNSEFVDLTKKAQYIHTLKKHIKKQIRNTVNPR